jgi:hypothetical protein
MGHNVAYSSVCLMKTPWIELAAFQCHRVCFNLYWSPELKVFNWYQSLVHSVLDLFLEYILFDFCFLIIMSQNLNFVPPFDGTNYGYWKARMRFFLKSIDIWKIVESGWIKLEETDEITVIQTSARLSNDKALHALCQALSPSEFVRISNCEIAKDAWQVLETTYETQN